MAVGVIQNETMQHIREETITQHTIRNLKRSGAIQFVEAEEERTSARFSTRCECGPHRPNASMAENVGTDFMLYGSISSSITDESGGDKARVLYTVNLVLLNVETDERVWRAEKEIEKVIARSTIRTAGNVSTFANR